MVVPLKAALGNTETSAPLSTRKSKPVALSRRHRELGPRGGACVARTWLTIGAGLRVPDATGVRRKRFPTEGVADLPEIFLALSGSSSDTAQGERSYRLRDHIVSV